MPVTYFSHTLDLIVKTSLVQASVYSDIHHKTPKIKQNTWIVSVKLLRWRLDGRAHVTCCRGFIWTCTSGCWFGQLEQQQFLCVVMNMRLSVNIWGFHNHSSLPPRSSLRNRVSPSKLLPLDKMMQDYLPEKVKDHILQNWTFSFSYWFRAGTGKPSSQGLLLCMSNAGFRLYDFYSLIKIIKVRLQDVKSVDN